MKNVLQQINFMMQWNDFATLQQIGFIMQRNNFVAKWPDTKIAIQPQTSPMHAAISYYFTQVPWIELKHVWIINVWDLAEILPN